MLMPSKHVIRTSDRLFFKRCREAWNFGSSQRLGYSPAVTPKPLEFGIAMHEAWDIYYDPDYWHLPQDFKHRLMRSKFFETVRKQKKAYEDIKDDLPWELEEEFKERLELGLGMIDHYVKWAPTVDKGFKPVKTEIEFEVPILDPFGYQMTCKCHGWDVFYQGRIDGIVQDEFGYYWILEHKTAGQLQDPRFLVLDEQCGSYAWALRSLGVRVKGVIYNEALKAWPSRPTPLKMPREGRNFSVNRQQRTTYEVYLDTLVEHGENISLYEDFLSFLREQGNPFFRRTQVHRSDKELDNLGHRIYMEALDILDPDLHIYPSPTRMNCQGCSYREPCVMKQEGSDYEFLLNESGLFRRGRPEDSSEPREAPAEAGSVRST